jgi:choline dehydrogenase-like flavoprotein
VIIGSGFGGSVAALRAAEKGYRVSVMESGRRWKDDDIPKTQWNLPHFLWSPRRSCTGSRGSSRWTMYSSSLATEALNVYEVQEVEGGIQIRV